MKVTAIIQARMTSSRLPGKILMEVLGKPLLQLMIERVQQAKSIDSVVLATTTNKEDDPTVKLGESLGIEVFRGSEDDVLDRFYNAADKFGGEHIMRLTGDCPLIDPEFLDKLASFYFEGGYDYAANCVDPTLPDGLDAEIISMESLVETHQKATRDPHREHVTLYVRDNAEDFKIGSWKHDTDYSQLRWTVDSREDFELVKDIIEGVAPEKQNFRMKDIIEFLKTHPEIAEINSHIKRNEGLDKSLAEEAENEHEKSSDQG
ncbi:glycosyltransferase family protein [Maridesulfovibrio sp.]|uniref:glycosyltransferase family protein n=1 Tax=Maridesulfovibrio sp. TaxID=2795000 RepID=UPI002A1875BC|nr:glycosyltransferase family protein [Maridesulfovibrio sp.]